MTEEVVCEREFNTLIGGEAFPILVQWMKPTADGLSWRCNYLIAWPDRPVRRSHAMGADSAQALILALFMVSTELETGSWPVRWFEDEEDLGLPTLSYHDHRIRVITARGAWPQDAGSADSDPASDS